MTIKQQTVDSQNLASIFESLNSNKNITALKQIGVAVSEVLASEKMALGQDIFVKDIKPIGEKAKNFASQAKSLGSKALSLAKYSKEKISEGKADELFHEAKESTSEAYESGKKTTSELMDSAKNIPLLAKSHIVQFGDRISTEYSALESEDEKARYIIKLSIYASVLAAGLYAGHEAPDWDIKKLGIGTHRSFISHSIVPFFIVSSGLTLLKRLLERADKHLEESPEAAALNHEVQTVLSLFGVGVGTGLAVHLAVDGLIQRGGTIRIHDLNGNSYGSIVGGARLDDIAYTTAMSLFTFHATKENIEAG